MTSSKIIELSRPEVIFLEGWGRKGVGESGDKIEVWIYDKF